MLNEHVGLLLDVSGFCYVLIKECMICKLYVIYNLALVMYTYSALTKVKNRHTSDPNIHDHVFSWELLTHPLNLRQAGQAFLNHQPLTLLSQLHLKQILSRDIRRRYLTAVERIIDCVHYTHRLYYHSSYLEAHERFAMACLH